MVLFKSNCIILRHYRSIDAKHIIKSLKRQQNNCIWKYLFNIGIEVNIVDPDQTAPIGAVWSWSALFVFEASHIVVDDKNIHFVIMRFKGLREFSVYTVRIFMKCTHVCASQATY